MALSFWPIVVLILGVILGGGLYWVWRRRRGSPGPVGENTGEVSTWEERELEAMLADMSSPGGSPRPQHYDFAHRLLRQRFVRDPPGLGRLVVGQDGGLFLQALWNEAMPALETVGPILSRGLGRSVEPWEAGTIIIVTLPEPQAITEAHMVALVLPETGAPRYFTLEAGFHEDMTSRTALCEWRDGSHVNYGDGPRPDPETFAAAVRLHVDPTGGN